LEITLFSYPYLLTRLSGRGLRPGTHRLNKRRLLKGEESLPSIMSPYSKRKTRKLTLKVKKKEGEGRAGAPNGHPVTDDG
jgi:hypothetical protein